MKEKKKVEVPEGDLQIVTNKRGALSYKGKCPDCGTTVYRIKPKSG